MVQMNNEKLVLRVKFTKTGALQYISHLDLVRTMNKVIVRAGLPLWYTEGFNPKPKMVFAAPLSIGTESNTEFMDVRLTERIDPEEAMARLNANMTGEMQVTEAYYPESKFTDLKWLSYSVRITTVNPTEELARECERVLNAPVVEIVKSTKSGEALVNIRPLIKSASASLEGEEILLSLVLSADPSSFLNPEYAIKALKKYTAVLSSPDLLSEYYSIMRDGAYFEDMTDFR